MVPVVQRHHLPPFQLRRRAVGEIAGRHRADLAVGLRDDRRRAPATPAAPRRSRTAAAPARSRSRTRASMSPLGARDVEGRAADRGQPLHPGGEVALVRARHQPLAQPQRAHQLGAARQQRRDSRGRRRAVPVALIAGDPAGAAPAAPRAARAARRRRAPRSLSPGQPHLDVHAAHHRQTVHAQQRRVRIGVGGRAVDVGEPAHDRRAVHLHRQPGRHDDVDAAHHRGHLDVDDAGREAGLAQIQVGAPEQRDDAHPARHVPGPAAIDAAEDRVDRVAVPLVVGQQRGARPVGTTAVAGAAGASTSGRSASSASMSAGLSDVCATVTRRSNSSTSSVSCAKWSDRRAITRSRVSCARRISARSVGLRCGCGSRASGGSPVVTARV